MSMEYKPTAEWRDPMTSDMIEMVAKAICKSRTCEGVSCCQWPAQGGRTQCPVRDGGYNAAAIDAINAMDAWRFKAAGIGGDVEQPRPTREAPHE